MENEYEVLIVGAGLSGIGMGFHLQKKCPGIKYAILEGRERMGGTWDLFRYPGIRSDSDMYTLGFPFRPWKSPNAIADGPSILSYIKETAQEFNIDEKILYNHKVKKASWSSSEKQWTITLSDGRVLKSKFLIMCAGYYNYDQGYTPNFEGLDEFLGEFVHPQKWKEGLDYENKNIVVIGSGATSVTLVPELAKKANHVVMLQRSPSYVASLPQVDAMAEMIKKFLPEKLAHHFIRWKNILFSMAFFNFCRKMPSLAKKLLLKGVKLNLKDEDLLPQHFNPKYGPWDQRLCFVPDGDLFEAVNSKKASVKTDTISRFTKNGILLDSGEELKTDIVVCATGLNLKFLGGLEFLVDGEEVKPSELVPYKSSMFSGIPNMGMVFGYTNASWTLKCNLTSEWLAKTIHFMRKNNYSIVSPKSNPQVSLKPLIDFSSGYFKRSENLLPKQGKDHPWKVNQNYFLDIYSFRVRPVNDVGLDFH